MRAPLAVASSRSACNASVLPGSGSGVIAMKLPGDAQGLAASLVGRKDDIIKSRGEKVSPKEVENVIYAFPGIKEAAVVGVPDELLGRALKAIVVAAEGVEIEARELVAHCLGRLEDFMVPRLVEFRAALPKTNTGKIRRAALQAEAEGRELPGDDE